MNKHLKLNFTNKTSKNISLFLEPVPEKFIIESNKAVVIHGIFESSELHNEFVIEFDDDGLTVFTPGPFDNYVDSYVTENGEKLTPTSWE